MLTFLLAFLVMFVTDFRMAVVFGVFLFSLLIIMGLRKLAREDGWYIPIMLRARRAPDFLPARTSFRGLSSDNIHR